MSKHVLLTPHHRFSFRRGYNRPAVFKTVSSKGMGRGYDGIFFFKSSDRLDDTRSPREGEIKTAAMSQARTAGELFSVEWFLAIKFLIDQFIRCFHSVVMKSTLLVDIFFSLSLPRLYFSACFRFSGCFINFLRLFFGRCPLNLHCFFDSRKQICEYLIAVFLPPVLISTPF